MVAHPRTARPLGMLQILLIPWPPPIHLLFLSPLFFFFSQMTTGMIQDTVQTLPSGSGPRFRPYACPNHHVTKGRYITSNDSRGYIPVYEYPLNGQWIMMDIDDGYILWTGIWKALGNSKADIVKMIDSQPDLAPLIRRVRGGYLKIQGTWMPYEVALKLSRRVAWPIREDLIPLFGPTFPSTCLSPDQPGYGQVVPTGQNKRRVRRTPRSSIMDMPRAPSGWTVVTPNMNMAAPSNAREPPPPFHPGANVRQSADYRMASPYPVHSQIPNGGYTGHPPPSYRGLVQPPPPSKAGLSLDVRGGNSESRLKEEFNLPPIHAPDSNNSSTSPWSLPPISSIEDIRRAVPQDSAAVLRRLRMDDDGYNKSGRYNEDHTWNRRQSISTHHSSSPKSIETSPRFQPYTSSRLHPDHSVNRGHSPVSSYHPSRAAVRSDASQYSHEGDSTSNPSPTSPTSPTTPSSALSEYDSHYLHLRGNVKQGKQPQHHQLLNEYTDRIQSHQRSTPRHLHGLLMERPEMVRRDSSSDGDSNQPHRPW